MKDVGMSTCNCHPCLIILFVHFLVLPSLLHSKIYIILVCVLFRVNTDQQRSPLYSSWQFNFKINVQPVVIYVTFQAKPVRGTKRCALLWTWLYPCSICTVLSRPRGPSVEASGDIEQNYQKELYEVLCVARQRIFTKFAVVAWRHSVMLAMQLPVQSMWRLSFCSFIRDT